MINLLVFSVSVIVLFCSPCSVRAATDKVVCYYTQWSIYRQAEGMFSSAELDPNLCTHYLYAFAGIEGDDTSDSCNGCIKSFDPNLDISRNGYTNFTSRKQDNPSAKFMLSLGGGKEGSDRFSKLARNETVRKNFARNLLKDLEQYGFDGVDFCWQYPTFRLGAIPEDRENYVLLVKEVKELFEKHAAKNNLPRMQISLVLPSLRSFIPGFDLKNLEKYVDFMNIVNYDYHLSDDPATFHHSPLYPIKEDIGNEGLNDDATIQYYIKLGVNPTKLILGIPTFGRSFILEEENENGFGSPTLGKGPKGPITGTDGYLAYYEICAMMRDEPGWTEVRSNATAVGPYIFKENVWIGFDNEDMVARKARYAKSQNLGGIMYWALDMDDFRGSCSDTKNPLIKAGRRGLGLVAHKPPVSPGRRAMDKNHVFSTVVSTLSALAHDDIKVVCYYTNWSAKRNASGKLSSDQINPFICSHYLYAFAQLTKDGIKSMDEDIDFNQNGIRNFTNLKNKNPDSKFLLSVKWENDSKSFALIAKDSVHRKNFVQIVVQQLIELGFDGIDLNLVFPRNRNKQDDSSSYLLLIMELRAELNRVASETGQHKMVLSVMVPFQEYTPGNNIDLKELSKYVDFMNIATHDIHRPGEPAVFHHSPLKPIPFELEQDLNEGLNVDAIVRKYLLLVSDPSKLVMGIPSFASSMLLQDPDINEFGSQAVGNGPAGPYTRYPGTLAYYEVCQEMRDNEYKEEKPNPDAAGPYIYKKNIWISYDDEAMVRKKAEYALGMHLGGIMFWTLDYDDFQGLCGPRTNPLIKAGRRGLGLPVQTTPPPIKTTTLAPQTAPNFSIDPVTEPQLFPILPPPPKPASKRVPLKPRPPVPRPINPIRPAADSKATPIVYAAESSSQSSPPIPRPNTISRPPKPLKFPSRPSILSLPIPDTGRSDNRPLPFSNSPDGHQPIIINNPQNVNFYMNWVYNVYDSTTNEATNDQK